jgi:hypothetical protein
METVKIWLQMNLLTPHPALSPLRGEGEEAERTLY